MVQWTNLQQINRLVNLMRLYTSCEDSEGLHPAEADLTSAMRYNIFVRIVNVHHYHDNRDTWLHYRDERISIIAQP